MLCSPARSHLVWTTIADLLSLRRPSAVARLIILIVINPVDAVCWRRTAAHISDEVQIRGVPTVTDANATRAVLRVPRIIRIIATLAHLRPDLIFRFAVRRAAQFGIPFVPRADQFPLKATARSRRPVLEGAPEDAALRSAFAAAHKMIVARSAANNGPASESLSNGDRIGRGHERPRARLRLPSGGWALRAFSRCDHSMEFSP